MSEAALSDDIPLRLEQAVAVMGARGYPLTVSMLRTEIRKGRLIPVEVAGKFFVTPRQIRDLFTPCPVAPKALASTSAQAGGTSVPESPSPTSGSSEMERLRAAQAAALSSRRRPSESSQTTSPRNSRRQPSKPTAAVIRPSFSSPR
jgi:hypothetical protein